MDRGREHEERAERKTFYLVSKGLASLLVQGRKGFEHRINKGIASLYLRAWPVLRYGDINKALRRIESWAPFLEYENRSIESVATRTFIPLEVLD